VLAAFRTYYETATLAAATDPDIVHNLRTKLDAAGHYSDEDVERVVTVTNAFSKKVENHAAASALYFMYYNFGRIHQTLRVTRWMLVSPTTLGASRKSSAC
jgi:hypothetical protein